MSEIEIYTLESRTPDTGRWKLEEAARTDYEKKTFATRMFWFFKCQQQEILNRQAALDEVRGLAARTARSLKPGCDVQIVEHRLAMDANYHYPKMVG